MPKPVYGPEMCDALNASGIPAKIVTRKRDSGYYIADFFEPDLREAVQPASVYAAMIAEGLTGIRIIDTGQQQAHWRPGKPVIMASVTFTRDTSVTNSTPEHQAQPATNHAQDDQGGVENEKQQPPQTANGYAGKPPVPPIGIMTYAATPGPMRYWDRRGQRVMGPSFM